MNFNALIALPFSCAVFFTIACDSLDTADTDRSPSGDTATAEIDNDSDHDSPSDSDSASDTETPSEGNSDPDTSVEPFVFDSDAYLAELGAFGNDWVAVDGLGRELPTYKDVGAPRGDRFVGVFYWLWHSYIRLKNGLQQTVPQLLAENPDSPAFECNDYYWGEPENGFYHPSDPWVARRNLQMLANAGVDFIFFDYTNGPLGQDSLDDFMGVWLEMNTAGIPVPKIVFFLNEGYDAAINSIMDRFYNRPEYMISWFLWDGKPLIMADQTKACSQSARACTPEVTDFFTWRKTWAFDANQWNFLDTFPQDYMEINGVAEQITVTKSMGAPLWDANTQGSSYHGGITPVYDQYWETPLSSQGLFFEEQWSRAHEVDPQIVTITGWNELSAAAWPTTASNPIPFMRKNWDDPSWRCVNHDTCLSKDQWGNHIPHGWHFVDEFNTEFNRDIEPMKGGYSDSYYFQMVAHIRKFKGLHAPAPNSPQKTIDIGNGFSDWEGVWPRFRDPPGDTAHRNFKDVRDAQIYLNTSGRNDIVESRVTCDNKSIYFYVKTAQPLTSSSDTNWMLLLIDADNNKETGWEGFDYLINGRVATARKTSVSRFENGAWTEIALADFHASGSELELRIPAIISNDTLLNGFQFHIADNPAHLNDISGFFTDGDSAPDRRFNYSFACED